MWLKTNWNIQQQFHKNYISVNIIALFSLSHANYGGCAHACFVKVVKLSGDSLTFRKGLYANYTYFCECIVFKNNDLSVKCKLWSSRLTHIKSYECIWMFYGLVVAVLKYCLAVLCCSLCGFIDAERCCMALVHKSICLHYMIWGLKKKTDSLEVTFKFTNCLRVTISQTQTNAS